MIRLNILTLLFISFSIKLIAQSKTCNCNILLNETIDKVSRIYAGYTDKVNSKTAQDYKRLVNQLKIKASDSKSERNCYEILKQYTDWFHDGHVSLWYGYQSSPATIRKVNLKQVKITSNPNSIEGLWIDKGSEYAIVKDISGVNKYIAIVIKTSDAGWQPGMVKAEFYYYDSKLNWFRGMFYQSDFKGVLDAFTWKGDHMDHWFGPSWYCKDKKATSNSESNLDKVQLRIINKNFIYLRLPHFDQWYTDQLDSLIRTYKTTIRRTENIIIDLRGNSGGSSGASEEMIKLVYTNPIIYPAWEYRSSNEKIISQEKYVNELEANDPYHMLKRQKDLLKLLQEHPGELVSTKDSIVRKEDTVFLYPKHVIILIDEQSGSSSEFFISEGKQSKKVMLFGQYSAGVMDYGEAQSFSLSCGNYQLSVPWGKNGWVNKLGMRIDNIGFKPDVIIPHSERDWIKFVERYFKNHIR